MKIRNDQMQALQQQADLRVQPKRGGEFDALLAEKMIQADAGGEVSSAFPQTRAVQAMFSPVMSALSALSSEDEGGDGEGDLSLELVSQSMDGIFDTMESYAASLNAEGGDLRASYSLLQDMEKSVQALRSAAPNLAERHAGLDAALSELEVLAVTEGFKFNRGDYI